MINNLINSKLFAGLTATVAFTGVMANAGIANAAALIGEFQFSSQGSAELTEDSLTFFDLEGNEGSIPLSIAFNTATGSFNQFAGTDTMINGSVFFAPFESPNPFIDFGDGNEFSLLNARIEEVVQSGKNASVVVILEGIFTSENGDQTDGAGNLTFQFNNTLASTIEDQLEDGEIPLTGQFSGALFATASTPEPTAL
ncbi:MAG: hypothetical protein F6K39_16755, partial [Okeania sp. SIO3B3]|nr:hypothetical protein [Okeania sp. SIO3B3]